MTEPFINDARLAALMHAAQEGDSAAYLELLQTVTPYLRRIVVYRRGFAGREDVEDLVQDILLSLHAFRRDLRSASALHALAPRNRPASSGRWGSPLCAPEVARG